MTKIYSYACGDILHLGHIKHFQKAKKIGNHHIVGVLTDSAIRERKPNPILPYKERAEMIRSLKCVDEVVQQRTYSPIPNCKRIKPNILMESNSHRVEDIEEYKEIVKLWGGKVVVNPYYSKQSSTAIKEKIEK